MGPFKTVALAAAVRNAGGMGTISMPGMSQEPSEGAAIMRSHIEPGFTAPYCAFMIFAQRLRPARNFATCSNRLPKQLKLNDSRPANSSTGSPRRMTSSA